MKTKHLGDNHEQTSMEQQMHEAVGMAIESAQERD
jgi:hypothetical protein